jgi:hypothetical protein
MSERIDQFCEDLRQRLTEVEERVNEAKSCLDASVKDDEEAFETRKERVRARLDAARDHADQTRKDLKDRAAKLGSDVKEKVAEWKASFQRDRLEDRAADTTDYARLAIVGAVRAIEEAEMAVLDALAARRDLEAAETKAKAA